MCIVTANMTLSPGFKLGPYEIVEPIGAVGMGEVYRARDARLGRDVALKVLPASLSRDAERLKRFALEARVASALNHTNILSIFDVGSHEVRHTGDGATGGRERLNNHVGHKSKGRVQASQPTPGGGATGSGAPGAGSGGVDAAGNPQTGIVLPARKITDYGIQIANDLQRRMKRESCTVT